MSKKMRNALRTALLVFASAVLGVHLYLWNAKTLMGNALPMPFGYGAAVVLTGSMEPAIMADDLIIVKEGGEFRTGDIVVYQSGNMLVVHRIVAVDADTVTTQGDANNAPDAPVRREMIKGHVVATLPGMGAAARLLKTPAVTITLIGGALLLSELSYRKEKEKDQDELEKIKEEIRKLKAEQE
ncbi:MAG: signal peptidase I [Oscillospiraceae bacterium]|nr:signal peptidase I [Oscillospiraceae bacterium]